MEVPGNGISGVEFVRENPHREEPTLLRDSERFFAELGLPLTPEQRAAVAHVDGPLLVVAGPGSGKTTVITCRAAYLAQVAGVDPAQMLVVTFTRAAADAMKSRTAEVAGADVARRALFGTFHALAWRILAARGDRPQVLEEGEQLSLLRQTMRALGLNLDDETVQAVLADLARLRAEVDDCGGGHFKPTALAPHEFQRVREGYDEAKARLGKLDFDDLLHRALALLRSEPRVLAGLQERFHYLMIDEFQDTNAVQWELTRLLAEPRRNLAVVGDDDQSVYGWRGAAPRFLLQFPAAYPGAARVTLGLNQRCPAPVVGVSARLAEQNRERFAKALQAAGAVRAAAGPAGADVIAVTRPVDSLQEAETIVQLVRRSGEPGRWGVLYRTNEQGTVIARELTRAGIPYRALGGLPNPYRRWPVQDVLSYLKAAVGINGALEQVINRPNRYISRAVLEGARKVASRTGADLFEAIARTGLLKHWQLRPLEELDDHLRRIATMTAPQAIGYVRRLVGYDEYIKEYCEREGGSSAEIMDLLDDVERTCPRLMLPAFLADADAQSAGLPAATGEEGAAVTLATCHKAKGLEFPFVIVAGAVDGVMPHRSAADLEEERRLMYVAMTRASERLLFSAPKTWGGRGCQPSPFLAEAGVKVGE